MKTKITLAAGAAVLALAATGAALADHHGKGHRHDERAERMIERMDADADGAVTRDEAKAFAAERFAKMDIDGDGTVTRPERRAHRAERRVMRGAERFARIDADGDGMVSVDEMKAMAAERAARRFERLDADSDGMVSLAEMQEARGDRRRGMRESRREMRRERREERRAARDERREDRRAMGRGPVTAERMEERVLRRFDRMDADGDGVLTLEEARDARRPGKRG